ncbi:hypothetical protein U1Q18_006882 [Sarracenia purpurea var. burkii]
MVEPTFLLPLMLSLLLIHLSVSGEKTVLPLHKFPWKQLSTSNSPSCSAQKSRIEKGATILEMKHRDYCSGPINDWNEKLQKRLISDENWVHYLQSRITNSVSGRIEGLSQSQIPLFSGIQVQTLNYIVTAELGGQNLTVIVDTGSDLTWVQCRPCQMCYNQQDPLFNPSISPSYQSVSCDTPTCQSLRLATGNSGVCGSTGTTPPPCNYKVSYGDGSYTRGNLARDRLRLGTTAVGGFVFGCGRNNRGLFGGASGLMGLGRSDLSLVSQSSSVFGGVFSYCLPSTDAGASGSLVLGGDPSVYKNSTPVSYTRLVQNQNPRLSVFYLVNLTGITIGGVTLQAPNSGNGGNGILVDSGTVITRLPPAIYRATKAEFQKQFSGFPTAPSFSILDTCFNLTGYEEVEIPTIKMNFEGGAELSVDASGTFYFVKADGSQVCLALASLSNEDETAIVGNYQQRNTRVVYDTKESKIGFARETCNFFA